MTALARRTRGFLLGGCLLAAALCIPGVASAAIIGSDLKPAPDPQGGWGCGLTTCMLMQTALPGNPHPTKSPFSGVITKWRYRKATDDHTYDVRFRVVKRGDGGQWRVVHQSPLELMPMPSGTYVFREHLPIRKGQFIAVQIVGSVAAMYAEQPGSCLQWYPSPPFGNLTPPDYNCGGGSTYEFLWNATVERRHRSRARPAR